LFFFDSLDNLDDILFDDAVASFPIEIFHPCYDYCNDDIFLNRYKKTGTETYFETATYAINPPDNQSQLTSLLNKPSVSSYDTSIDDQVKLELPSVDYLPSFDPFLLNDRSSLSSPSEAPFCLPCNESIPSSDNIASFLNTFDVLAQSRLLSTLLPSVSITSSYKLLQRSDPRFTVILLEARQLQLNLSNYDERVAMPMHQPAIYHSNKTDELPIVIDTGASCSLTPIHSDFTGTIDPSNVPTLNRIPVMAPILAPILGVNFFRGHISLKNGTFCPLFSHDSSSFKNMCLLT
jgi:hypothetical protein